MDCRMNHKTLAIVTDVWWPQVNGVVNTLMQTRAALTVPVTRSPC